MEPWSQAEVIFSENVAALINWIVRGCSSWQSSGFFFWWGDIFKPMTSCSLGRHLQGWSRPSPQLFAKGGKGLSQEGSAPADYKTQHDSLPVYQDPILKSQWFIESNAHILYNEMVLQHCQHKAGTCCLLLLPSNPSKPAARFRNAHLESLPHQNPTQFILILYYHTIPYFSDFHASGGEFQINRITIISVLKSGRGF